MTTDEHPEHSGNGAAPDSQTHEPVDESAAVDLIPARMLNEFVYCPRLFHFEHVLGEFEHNLDTIEGRSTHRRVDQELGKLPPPPGYEQAPAAESTSGDAIDRPYRATSIMLSAANLGAIARIDVIEGSGSRAIPIDYKKGSKPDIPDGAYEPERVQVCVQGLILRENGYDCPYGEIYFAGSKERVRVEFDDDLIHRTRTYLVQAREAAQSRSIPPPLVDSPKCPRCSLVGVCLPDETNFLTARAARLTPDDVRRLVPVRDDAAPLYLQEQGSSLAKNGDTLEVREKGKKVRSVRLLDVTQVNLFGAVQISTQLVQELCRNEIPVCYYSYGGWFNGMTTGHAHRNVLLRREQFSKATSEAFALRLAGQMIRGKILNARTLLRRNHRDCPRDTLKEMTRFAYSTGRAKGLDSLLGIEGAAAKLYFREFGAMLRNGSGSDLPEFDFTGRNRRPPRDPVNAMLSLLYAVLTKDLAVTARAVGFDPYVGFLHQLRPGRPALALDLMEEFRPLIVDSVVLQLIRTGQVKSSDFVQRGGSCSLTSPGRRRVLEGYERRMASTITHPVFGYTVSYRRVLEIQTRLLARYVTGEIDTYPPFRTR